MLLLLVTYNYASLIRERRRFPNPTKVSPRPKCICQSLGLSRLRSRFVEIKYYHLLMPLEITPRLIDHGIIFLREGRLNLPVITQQYKCYIITECWGVSLAEKYLPREIRDDYLGPGVTCAYLIEDWARLEELFPSLYFPQKILFQVKAILLCLVKNNYDHCDVHPGNFVVNIQEKVRINRPRANGDFF